MKIGIIAHNAHPINEPYAGGLEMITHLLIKELRKRKHIVKVLCVEGSDYENDCMYYNNYHLDYNQDNSLQDVYEDLVQRSISLNNFINQDFDVIHNHSLHYQSIIAGNLTNIPFITSFHTPIFEDLNLGLVSVKNNVNQYFTAVSKSLASEYRKTIKSVDVVYNGIDVYKWKVKDTPLNERKSFFWMGRICKEKGLKECIELCDRYNVPLQIAGPKSDKDYFKNEIEPLLKYSDYCSYVGHLKHDEISDYLSNAKGLIFSSTWQEPYGLVIAEALASGIPIAANNVGAAPEILTPNCGAIYSLNNPKSFKEAIEKISRLKIEDCRRRAETFCSHKTMVENYEKLYVSLIAKKLQVW